MLFDRKTLIIPDNTVFEEHVIVTDGDVIVSDGAKVGFGIKTEGRIFVGEHALVDGSLDAKGDIHVDLFSEIKGDVSSERNVYLGERVVVNGKLSVKGDLDVGDNVDIKEGFKVKGWINLRGPIPFIIYIFIYLLQLLKLGRSEEIERILSEFEKNEGEPIPVSPVFLFIPTNAVVGIQRSKTDADVVVGANCKILGNFEGAGNICVDDDSSIHGSLSSKGTITLGGKVEIHGSLFSQGDVYLGEECVVHGGVTAERLFLPRNSMVEGTIFAEKGVTFSAAKKKGLDEKLERF
ncbi:MAG TPA: hypothetical protein EYP23_03240, partial [Thermoplasmata archaeon]|nr:hypothetical protein [Thermoplasmata archaeon]